MIGAKDGKMDPRTRLLVIATAVVVGAFVADKAFSGLFWDPWTKTKQELVRTELTIFQAKAALEQEPKARSSWNKIRERLDEPKTPDVHTHFIAHLSDLFEKVGVDNVDISENPQAQQQGDFKEYIFDTKFKLTWGQFVDLLVELHNSQEFLKPVRINVGSQYEKEDRLDLELKVSTIEYAPVPARPGGK